MIAFNSWRCVSRRSSARLCIRSDADSQASVSACISETSWGKEVPIFSRFASWTLVGASSRYPRLSRMASNVFERRFPGSLNTTGRCWLRYIFSQVEIFSRIFLREGYRARMEFARRVYPLAKRTTQPSTRMVCNAGLAFNESSSMVWINASSPALFANHPRSPEVQGLYCVSAGIMLPVGSEVCKHRNRHSALRLFE